MLHLLATQSQTNYQVLDPATTAGLLACLGLLAARGIISRPKLPIEVRGGGCGPRLVLVPRL